MLDVIQKIFGDSNERELKKLWPVVEEIKSFDAKMKLLSDDQLRGKTDEFKQQIAEAVAPIEEETAELKARLKGAKPAVEVGGNGRNWGLGKAARDEDLVAVGVAKPTAHVDLDFGHLDHAQRIFIVIIGIEQPRQLRLERRVVVLPPSCVG